MTDSDYMRMALELAEKGRGLTSPNPMVGAVAVRGGQVVGTGYHPGPGHPHAEVFALEGLEAGLRDVTLYTTLEPCSFVGRTPACVDLILDRGVGRVVCAMEDPDPRVAGTSVGRLKDAGVKVETGVLLDAAEQLNEAYVKHRLTGLPFVTLKLAMTADGYLATASGDSRWITGEPARIRAHAMRAAADAVMVGLGTVLADDPELTVRHLSGRSPQKIVLDSRLEIAGRPEAKVFQGERVYVACREDADVSRALKVESAGGTLWRFPGDRPSLRGVLRQAAEQGFLNVLIEGGGSVAGSAMAEDVVDRLALFVAPKILGGGVRAVEGMRLDHVADAVPLEDVVVEPVGEDILYTARVGERSRGG